MPLDGSILQAIQPKITVPQGLAGYWSLDLADLNWGGNIAYDRSGRNNHGTLSNLSSSSLSAGKVRQALTFNGTSSRITTTSIFSGAKTRLSMCGWGYRSSTSNLIIFGWGDTGSRRFQILAFSDSKVYCQIEDGANNFPNFAFSGTGWHHFGLTFDGALSAADRVVGYLDGRKQTLTLGAGNPAQYTITGNFEIGRGQGDGRFTTGMHDDVRAYDGVLTAQQMLSIYEAGRCGRT